MSWFLAFAGFAVLIILHEFGHFLAAKRVGMRVERFFLFFPPKLVSIKRGETEYGIGAIPAGGFVRITGMNPDEELEPEVAPRAYYNQPVWKRIVVIAAGPLMNALIAFFIFFSLAFGVTELTKRIGRIESGSPAVGKLRPGDEIVAVDGRRGSGRTLARQVNRHRCPGPGRPTDGCVASSAATFTIRRDGRLMRVRIRPEYDAAVKRTRVGFSYALQDADPSIPEAARISGSFMWEVTSSTVSVLGKIFKAREREQISGVVGSYEVTRKAIEFDSRRALLLLGVISLSLAVINLFPFLPLDGGHIFWSLVEKVRGRPVPFTVMERASAFGFLLVIMLFVIGLSNDIGRLTGEGFQVR
jgi:regulator of sigma E protease